MDKNKEQRGLGLRGRVLLEEVVSSFYELRPFFMANGKTKTKNYKNVEVPWSVALYGMEKENKK